MRGSTEPTHEGYEPKHHEQRVGRGSAVHGRVSAVPADVHLPRHVWELRAVWTSGMHAVGGLPGIAFLQYLHVPGH